MLQDRLGHKAHAAMVNCTDGPRPARRAGACGGVIRRDEGKRKRRSGDHGGLGSGPTSLPFPAPTAAVLATPRDPPPRPHPGTAQAPPPPTTMAAHVNAD